MVSGIFGARGEARGVMRLLTRKPLGGFARGLAVFGKAGKKEENPLKNGCASGARA